ncbi:phage tail protein [Clostridium sp. SYSU_GA19001]|uniref:phage tail spike protein n=1 Tax=Clostridium caldaquaticum TaxID=2940653 RepID=UPI00207753C6|nr:phage tail spike protein [Clostridium caldaquaticum]MCM8710840.1 phage tail protein [Clostridium caldaquaticum]
MIYVYDKKTVRGNFDNNGLAVLDECITAEVTHELNGDYSLEIQYPVVSKKAQYLEEFNIIKADGQLFRIYKVERTQDKISKVKVWARHIFYDLAFYFIESAKVLNANMKEAIEGTMPPELQGLFFFKAPEKNIAPFAVKEVNAVDAVFRLIEIYGGELFRDNFNIEIKNYIGENNGILIKYGKNIKGMKVIEDTSELATRIYAVGANNLLLPERYIEVEGERAKLLPYPITKRVEFKECKDVESLRARAEEYAEKAASPKVFITIDFMELSKTEEYKSYSHLTKVNVGDFVKVRNEKIAVTTDLRVIKKKTDLINPINTKIELGDPLNTIIEKLDTSKLLEEIQSAISGTLSSVIIKKNSDTITISTSSYPAMIVGITAKADTNLNCNITMTGKASADCTLTILFSLDGKYYDFKPIQKLASGDNVIGLPLPMPQVTAGDHTFMVEMKVSNGTFTIEKNNLQVSIEGRDLEGGLSASIPRAEIVYTFLYNLFNIKIGTYTFNVGYDFKHYSDITSGEMDTCNFEVFNSRFNVGNAAHGNPALILNVMGIIEEFNNSKSSSYAFDAYWVEFSSDYDKNKDGTYDFYNRAAIKEPVLKREGGYIEDLGNGIIYAANVPDTTLYKDLLAINAYLKQV